MSAVDLGIVIVNWNTKDLLRNAIRTVVASTGLTYQLVVVDNASSDGSQAMVKTEFPQVTLIENTENEGFSRGNNRGLRHLGFDLGKNEPAAPRYALLLNSDTEVPPHALVEMVAYMDRTDRQDVGCAGCKLIMGNGELDIACRRSFPSPEVSFYRMVGLSKLFPKSPKFARYNMTYLDPNIETEVDSVVGAFMMLRREVITQVGLLNEDYWMYGEDLDWAFRIKEAGWKIMYNPAVTILHLKRASSKKSKKANTAFYQAMVKFYRDHYRDQTPLLLHIAVMGGLVVKGGPSVWELVRHPEKELD
jgi:N-acetylglucosaminyl-diphospho-decaprenol L-rhamnosyltransferase